MKFGILGNSESWYGRDLSRAAANSGHSIEYFSFESLFDHLGGIDPHPTKTLDCLLVRSMPPGSLEQVIFRMDVLRSIESNGVRILNTPHALEIAIDKYLSLSKMAEENLPVPESFICQTVDQAMDGFERLDHDAVVKPIFGSEGKGIVRVTDSDVAYRAFRLLVQSGSVVYLQRYIDHGNVDYRLLVLGDEVFAIRRCNPDDWRTNAARGALCEPCAAPDEMQSLAKRAASIVGAEFAGVDIAVEDNRCFILEVNAVPGWKAVSIATEVDIATKVLNYAARSNANSDIAKTAFKTSRVVSETSIE